MFHAVGLTLLLTALANFAFAQEAMTFPTSSGTNLAGHLYRSNSTDPTNPVVIALHGCGGLYATIGKRTGLPSARHHAMGQMLQAQGYHVLFPDSFGSRGVKSICSAAERQMNTAQITIAQRRDDTLAALAWVRQQAWADPQRVAVLGWSNGAMTLLAATDANHPTVRQSGLPFKTAIAFYPGCVNADKAGYRPNTSLTLLLGEDDDWTLPKPCIRMADRLKQLGEDVTLKVYPEAVHGFDTPLAGIRTHPDIPSNSADRAGQGVRTGQNADARADSWQRVRQTLGKAFAQ